MLVEVVATGREPPRGDHLLLTDGAVVELVDHLGQLLDRFVRLVLGLCTEDELDEWEIAV